MEHFSNDHKDHLNQHNNGHGASCFEFDGKSMEPETTACSEFPNGEKAIVEQILASKEINKSKIAGL